MDGARVQPFGGSRTSQDVSTLPDEASPEHQLWASALAGDGEAFGAIFDLHRNRLYRHCLRLVDTRADAEDVTASAFLELWRRRDEVRVVDRSVLPWLLVTATHLARNVRRSTHRHQALLARLPRPGPADDPAVRYLDDSMFEGLEPQLAATLRQLPLIDQQVLALVVLEGYSQTEAAEILRTSASAIKSRLHRLRSGLRAAPSFLNGVTP